MSINVFIVNCRLCHGVPRNVIVGDVAALLDSQTHYYGHINIISLGYSFTI